MKKIKNTAIILFCMSCLLYIVTKPELYYIWKLMYNHYDSLLNILGLLIALYAAGCAMLSWRFSTFNSIFTQLMCGHRDVYRKVVAKNDNPFTNFYEAYELKFRDKNLISKKNICDFYKSYLGLIDETSNNKIMETTDAINMCSYFKYIYHEVCFINNFKYLSSNKKKEYISMIQAQMSNHELFCYLINQIEHENQEYHRVLKMNKFFDNLHESVLSSTIDKISIEERQKLINL